MRIPNPKLDKLVSSTELKITFNVPALNFNTGQLDSCSLLHYTAQLYKGSDKYVYYIFNIHDDCTMYIMNCNKDVYDEIQKYIKLNDSIDIWESSDNDDDFTCIPNRYRHIKGTGGAAIIGF